MLLSALAEIAQHPCPIAQRRRGPRRALPASVDGLPATRDALRLIYPAPPVEIYPGRSVLPLDGR